MIGSRELLKGAVPAILFLGTLVFLVWVCTRPDDAGASAPTPAAAGPDGLPATAPGCAFVTAAPDNAYGGTLVHVMDLQPMAVVDVDLLSPQGAVTHQHGAAPSGGALAFDFAPGTWDRIYVHDDLGGCYVDPAAGGGWGMSTHRLAADWGGYYSSSPAPSSSPPSYQFDGQFPAGVRAPNGWILDSNGNITPAPAR